MSEQSGGPGWWQASDGLWYRPEQHPNHRPAQLAPPPPPPPLETMPRFGSTAGEKVAAVLIGLAIIGFAVTAIAATTRDSSPHYRVVDRGTSSGSTSRNTSSSTTEPASAVLFPGRVDAQREDQERNIGESAMLSGYTTTVTAAGFRQSISSYEDRGYIEIDVTIVNRDDKAQSFSTSDWRLQTPNGEVLNPTYGVDGELDSGDLVHGGTATGKVAFEIGSRRGDFYIIYKPDPFDAARGIWKVTAP